MMTDSEVCAVHRAPGGFYRHCGGLLPASSSPCSEGSDRHAWSLIYIHDERGDENGRRKSDSVENRAMSFPNSAIIDTTPFL